MPQTKPKFIIIEEWTEITFETARDPKYLDHEDFSKHFQPGEHDNPEEDKICVAIVYSGAELSRMIAWHKSQKPPTLGEVFHYDEPPKDANEEITPDVIYGIQKQWACETPDDG